MSESREVTSKSLVEYLEAGSASDKTRLAAVREWADRNPKAKPGETIVQFLVATGSGEARAQKVREFVDKMPDATADECLDFMIGNALPAGTIQKVGEFVKGNLFVYRPGGTSSVKDANEVVSLRQQLAEVKSQLAQTTGENIVLKKQNTQLQQRLSVLSSHDLTDQIRESEQPLGVGKANKREPALAGAK